MSSKRKSDSLQESSKNAKVAKKNQEEEPKDDGESSEFEDPVSSSDDDGKDDVDSDNDDTFFDNDDPNLKIKGPELAGQLLVMGRLNWDLNGRDKVPVKCKPNVGGTLWEPHAFGPLYDVRVKVAVSSSCSAHNVVITEDNKCFTFGRNDKGQLGTGKMDRRDQPFEPEELKTQVIVNAAVGKKHTLFLTERGHVYACGDNQYGQCGIQSKQKMVLLPTRVKYRGPPIVKIGCGRDFSMLLNIKGVLYSFGLPEHGQLGLGDSGEYFVSASKMSWHYKRVPVPIQSYIQKGKDNHTKVLDLPDIVDFACGTNHTVALDSRKRVFSWGFGGYGRLGHADCKDELKPRLINYFASQIRGIKSIFCGSTYTFAINEIDQTYFFGITKKTGEANMYPKQFTDLAGLNVRAIGCAETSNIFVTDKTTFVLGHYPCYGELGLSLDRKSCSTPMENKFLAKTHIHSVSCGICHTLLIVRNDTEEEKTRIADRFDEYDPPKP